MTPLSPLQQGTETGGDTGVTTPEVPDTSQPVAELLADVGVPDQLAGPLGQAIVFLVAFVLLWAIGRALLTPLVRRVMDSRGLDEHAKAPLLRLVTFVMLFVAVSVAFGLAGFGNFLTSLATIAAAATLAIGLAMQDVLANFVAGVFIYTDKPFRIGDWIEWDGNSGIVEDISLRVTRVRTFDNELLTVPNSQLTDGVIKNPVAKDELRLKFTFGIDYSDDIQQATEIIMTEAEDHPDIMDEPAPSVRLTELADSYVGLQSRIWIANPSRADFMRIRGDFVTNVKQRFDAEGISIPFPQMDLSGGIRLADGQTVAPESDD
ncbi:mechanosensitive ion channel family protein [Halomarina oriensis]|uniref:Mechanosensitive ion channel n=1 Tax=Halomarina oriensis TaxID=671145 RepID=A0A6B0GM79_9EURY|nr:mechanosensitive ion channel family protein [Halomarina oriensis]MWG35834.1 mechanosensitive ion channel [Halomarina oriensis]